MMHVTESPNLALCELTNQQRDQLAEALDRDGCVVLPGRLPEALRQAAEAAIDRIATTERAADPNCRSIKRQNCVALDPAFVDLMLYTPALQMAWDAMGPVFQLNQSNFQSRIAEPNAPMDFVAATGWHADGPRPRMFPKVATDAGHAVGLHYLKFGFFLTDLTHGSGGSLQVVRGSHRRPELDGIEHGRFDIQAYDADLIQFDLPAGSVVAFHQAQWHAAPANLSAIERKNLYISYCPTWMRPLDYELAREGEQPNGLPGLSPEASFLMGEYRPALRFWLPSEADSKRLSRYGRRV